MKYLAISAILFAPLVACDLGQYDPSAGDGGAAGDAGPPPDAAFAAECTQCHGKNDSPAPPFDLSGNTQTTARGVGAHQSHLDPAPTWHDRILCDDCHRVPETTGDSGHLDGDNVAELTFGGRATTGGASPDWNGTTCSGSYCHGGTLPGGQLTEPTWTIVDGSQKACGSCHAAPPPAPHPDSTDCGTCHPTIEPGTDHFLDPASHINGVVDLLPDGDGACDSCHGSDGVAAPPTDLAGNTARTSPGVGAHRQHLGASNQYREMSCSQCHVVPTSTSTPGHIDGDNQAEVPFDSLNGAAQYANATCTNLYCHGNGRGNNGTMSWTADPNLGCNSCHSDGGNADSMSGMHKKHLEEDMECTDCHASVVNGAMAIIAPNLHIDGAKSVLIASGGTWQPSTLRCSNLACHGSESWNDD